MTTTVTVIHGDGVGPEVMEAALTAIQATDVDVEWDTQVMGVDGRTSAGELLPAETLESIKRNGLALKGPLETPRNSREGSLNARLRRELDLYVSLRPCQALNARTGNPECDLLVVRENHEDVFMGIEFGHADPRTQLLRDLVVQTHQREISQDTGVSLRPISQRGADRAARAAFEWATAHKRRRVTVGHKANVMSASDRIFVDCAGQVANEYPNIEFDEMLIDTLCGRLVRAPSEFDVVLLPNLFGDIVSDIGAGLIGGTGMAPALNLGTDCAVFEAVHGVARRLAGKNIANPTALILCGALLLRRIGALGSAEVLEDALRDIFTACERATYDQDPSCASVGTREFGNAVAERVREIRSEGNDGGSSGDGQ